MATIPTIPSALNSVGPVASILERIYYATITPTPVPVGESGPWRPPQWSGAPSLTMTATDPTTGNQTAYVFDSNIRVEHEQQSVVTLNPVQTGAAITDHVYIQPARVTIEIMMSDAMQSFTLGQWATGPSKSVSCYQTLVALQGARMPVQLATRLQNYSNMIISEVRAEDTQQTAYGLRATISFINIITASVQTSTSGTSANGTGTTSALQQVTGSTLNGPTQSQPVPTSVTLQNNIQNATQNLMDSIDTIPSVNASGSWSSTNINSIPNALSSVGA